MIFLAYRRLNTLQNGKMGTAQIDNKTGQLEYEYEGQGYTKSPGFKWRYRGFKSIPIIINEKKPNIAYPLFKIGLIYDDEHAKWFATTWSVAVRLVFVAFCLLFLLV
jgi:hypothetical protein